MGMSQYKVTISLPFQCNYKAVDAIMMAERNLISIFTHGKVLHTHHYLTRTNIYFTIGKITLFQDKFFKQHELHNCVGLNIIQ